MPINREYMGLFKDGAPEHLMVRVSKGKGGIRCWCNHGLPVFTKNIKTIQVRQHLTCELCNGELRKWERFWSKREESVQ